MENRIIYKPNQTSNFPTTKEQALNSTEVTNSSIAECIFKLDMEENNLISALTFKLPAESQNQNE
jgi:hypothetical protein